MFINYVIQMTQNHYLEWIGLRIYVRRSIRYRLPNNPYKYADEYLELLDRSIVLIIGIFQEVAILIFTSETVWQK